MSELRLLEGGDAATKGIGAIDVERVKSFYSKMVAAGMYEKETLDPADAVTAEFVNRGVGVD